MRDGGVGGIDAAPLAVAGAADPEAAARRAGPRRGGETSRRPRRRAPATVCLQAVIADHGRRRGRRSVARPSAAASGGVHRGWAGRSAGPAGGSGARAKPLGLARHDRSRSASAAGSGRRQVWRAARASVPAAGPANRYRSPAAAGSPARRCGHRRWSTGAARPGADAQRRLPRRAFGRRAAGAGRFVAARSPNPRVLAPDSPRLELRQRPESCHGANPVQASHGHGFRAVSTATENSSRRRPCWPAQRRSWRGSAQPRSAPVRPSSGRRARAGNGASRRGDRPSAPRRWG